MTAELIQISMYVALFLIGMGATSLVIALHNRSQVKKVEKTESLTKNSESLTEIQNSIHQLTNKIETQELLMAELKEFSTRAMNRAAARSSKADQALERAEQLKQLMRENQQIEETGEETQVDMFDKPRLVRRNG